MRAANQRPTLALGTAVLLVGLTGCTAAGRRSVASYPRPDQALATRTTPGEREFPADQGPVAGAGKPALGLSDPDFSSSHPRVQGFVDQYQTSLRGFMQRALERGRRYLPRMARILREEGVPPELAYLPIVESGFSVQAVSHAGAVGPWQFVRGTGQRYGLRIDGYVDERRDPEKATRAAARYLRDLYERFGDWHLALAGYNTGEGNIERIQTKGCDDYWEMSDRGFLPNETSEFVPRFLAAIEVAKSPEEYGFEVTPEPRPHFETVEVMRPISLKAVAQLCGSDEETLRDLNPALNHGVVPPQGYRIRLPKGTREQFEVALAAYHEPPPPARPRAARTHTVRKGDTLERIARRYGVSTQALLQANHLRTGNGIKMGQQLLIPAKPGRSRVVASLSDPTSRYDLSAAPVQQFRVESSEFKDPGVLIDLWVGNSQL
jgi:membrane-bound lytic murein transglycosylase D